MARRVVVSGGGTGIGLATAAAFAADGDQVIIIGRRAAVLKEAAAKLNTAHGADLVTFATADLTDAGQAQAAVEAVALHGPVDVVVTNAGGNVAWGDDGTPAGVADGYRANFEANVITAVLLTEGLLPYLRRPGGRIVHLSSIAALRGPGSYGGAKAALHAYTYELAQRLGADGVTVNAVAPGYVEDTEFFGGRATPEFVQSRVAQTLVGRPGAPAEIAATIKYLASPEAGYLTGQILHVNGGAMLGR
ncbi:3-oxoacyl-ACP reductase [Sphaerisporangium krabiense]|uniref:3-oxoacyl-[acyl-carrier protein] reductase n=1 Tax=Sphaerisporangium krabiense TaxID=763782 RepID=A0A7W9DPI1_9ACTN|nr:SDR family oxidoreductase [Sphaerisporangium krabiense]MBB5625360.1 3-oxoacyl-[acyl-carrier protein] reductase [Sphaerisporangium krabiense]GII64125.1 3-oxoacyl-ACP reductase [Sphaerisporangium krabiense]